MARLSKHDTQRPDGARDDNEARVRRDDDGYARCLCDQCDECMPTAGIKERSSVQLREGRYVPRRCRAGVDNQFRGRQVERIVEGLREEVRCGESAERFGASSR